ncbi:hypothetical protein [uncultured Thiodictyon sp.]|uniref:hypothetical protein n=1 Tax=uncultured Thiodictyon sp. TaxID=1846217 RepID=UPI0025CF69F8|nr:hypothetical protein [uncultured Thiodictyon sp.]
MIFARGHSYPLGAAPRPRQVARKAHMAVPATKAGRCNANFIADEPKGSEEQAAH